MQMCNFRNKMSFYRCLRIWWIAVGWLTKLLITYHNSDYNTCLPWFFLWIHLDWEYWNVIFSRCGSWGKVDMTKEKCVKGGGCSGENKSRKRIGDQSGSVHCCPTWSPSIDDHDDDHRPHWWWMLMTKLNGILYYQKKSRRSPWWDFHSSEQISWPHLLRSCHNSTLDTGILIDRLWSIHLCAVHDKLTCLSVRSK